MLLAITNGVKRINVLVINGEVKLARCRLRTFPLRDGLIIYIVLSQTGWGVRWNIGEHGYW